MSSGYYRRDPSAALAGSIVCCPWLNVWLCWRRPPPHSTAWQVRSTSSIDSVTRCCCCEGPMSSRGQRPDHGRPQHAHGLTSTTGRRPRRGTGWRVRTNHRAHRPTLRLHDGRQRFSPLSARRVLLRRALLDDGSQKPPPRLLELYATRRAEGAHGRRPRATPVRRPELIPRPSRHAIHVHVHCARAAAARTAATRTDESPSRRPHPPTRPPTARLWRPHRRPGTRPPDAPSPRGPGDRTTSAPAAAREAAEASRHGRRAAGRGEKGGVHLLGPTPAEMDEAPAASEAARASLADLGAAPLSARFDRLADA